MHFVHYFQLFLMPDIELRLFIQVKQAPKVTEKFTVRVQLVGAQTTTYYFPQHKPVGNYRDNNVFPYMFLQLMNDL